MSYHITPSLTPGHNHIYKEIRKNLQYPEFKTRYNILAAAAVAKAKKDKDVAGAVFKAIKLDPEKWRLGHTKVFFRAGILGFMEEVRDDRIGEVLSWLQAQARAKSSRLIFKKLKEQKLKEFRLISLVIVNPPKCMNFLMNPYKFY